MPRNKPQADKKKHTIDYFNKSVPDSPEKGGKPYLEYKVHERRALVLQMIIQAGHPLAIHQGVLAEKFGVKQPTISNDVDVLKPLIIDRLSKLAETLTHSGYNKIINDLLKGNNRDRASAAKVIDMYNKYLFDMGKQKRDKDNMTVEQMKEIKINVIMPKAEDPTP